MGVVTDGAGRVLLVRGDRRGWEPPGGQVELGEDLIAALRREIREESGCEVSVGDLVAVYSNLGRPEEGTPEQVMATFLCEWRSGEPTGGDECLDAAWFSAEEALRRITHPAQATKLRDALAATGAVVYRAYRTRPWEMVTEHEA
jgi:ADP-ribose pyrophosphatase YjhB (NUDIX family)